MVSKNFSSTLSELRKERGLSQKEAAAELGISQALLSHYEKGIRECGHGFLIKAADFYGVSCDYLLGFTNDRIRTSGNEKKSGKSSFAGNATAVADFVAQVEGKNTEKIETMLSLMTLKLILAYTKSGNLPAEIIEKYTGGTENISFYRNAVDFAFNLTLKPEKKKSKPELLELSPEVAALADSAHNHILEFISKNTPDSAV